MSTNKTIMILGASILQLPAIDKAIEMGLRVVALDMNPDAVGFSRSGVVREVISTIDIDAAVDAARRHNIDGVMTLATDMPMRTVAAVADKCGLVGISIETAIKATDKAEMRKALRASGVPIPEFKTVGSYEEFTEAIKCITGSIVVKPADSSGSRGIIRICKGDDVKGAYNYAKQYSRSGTVLVEEYMEGPEVSVETIAVDGEVHVIQITDKKTTGAPHFVETGHTQPTKLSCTESINSIAIRANKALGIDVGPSHTEIILTEEGPKIVEIGARLGGDCITTHLVPLSTGVDMVEACILIALGESPSLEAQFKKGSAIRYFEQHAGTIEAIHGLKEAEQLPGVKQISIVHGVGETITDIVDSGSRMGFVITQGVNAEDAERKCETALGAIAVEEKDNAD